MSTDVNNQKAESGSTDCYEGDWGRVFRFNDLVEMQATFQGPEDTIGRLVQVRKGCGQFGSDVYFIRRKSGKLISWENSSMRKYEGPIAVDIDPTDSVNVEYTVSGGKFPEKGFIVEKPAQPQTPPELFSIMISSS
jgi:hypothetical protein